jgi:predicted NAD/FAD-binding protein
MTAPQEKKLRIKGPMVVTGNRLKDGAVVYRTGQAGWSTRLDDALVTSEAERATALLREANASDIEAVGAYVAPVLLDGERIRPGNLRERIRTQGPTFALPGAAG